MRLHATGRITCTRPATVECRAVVAAGLPFAPAPASAPASGLASSAKPTLRTHGKQSYQWRVRHAAKPGFFAVTTGGRTFGARCATRGGNGMRISGWRLQKTCTNKTPAKDVQILQTFASA